MHLYDETYKQRKQFEYSFQKTFIRVYQVSMILDAHGTQWTFAPQRLYARRAVTCVSLL